MQSCHETQIYLMFNRLLAEYVKDDADRTNWAIEGGEIGRLYGKCRCPPMTLKWRKSC